MPKRKARQRALEVEYSESLEAQRLAAKADADLFFLDTASTVDQRKAARRAKKAAKRNVQTSRAETSLVDKALAKLRRRQASAPREATDHIWADVDEPSERPVRKKKPALEAFGRVASAGQSYNPSLADHQTTVGEAVAIESRRLAKIESIEQWWKSRGKAADDADDARDDDVADGDDADESIPFVRRPPAPVTRAQRNKRRRQRAAEAIGKDRDGIKAQRRQLDGLKRIRSDLDREERERTARRKAHLAVKAVTPPIQPVEPPPVALSDELIASEGLLSKSTSLQSAPALLRFFRDGDVLAKHRSAEKRVIERKRLPKRKYRGAKLIARYRKPWVT